MVDFADNASINTRPTLRALSVTWGSVVISVSALRCNPIVPLFKLVSYIATSAFDTPRMPTLAVASIGQCPRSRGCCLCA